MIARCANCGSHVDPDDWSCGRCGAPVSRGRFRIYTDDNPFRNLKTRWVIPWAVLGFILSVMVLLIVSRDSDDQPSDPTHYLIALNAFFGTVAVWVFWSLRSKGIDIRRLVGRLPENYNWFPMIGILLVNMVFSLGAAIVVLSAITSASEPVARSLDTDPVVSNTLDPASLLLAIATAAVLAPVLEEVFFRGILINRWGIKWRPGIAIVASALLFGILHLIAIGGAFMFGTIAAVLYIKTRTLLVPIAMHVANNSLVTLVILAFPTDSAQTAPSPTSDAETPSMAFGLALLVLTTPILVWYLRKNWPRRDEMLPYQASGDGPLPTNATDARE